MVNQAPRWYHLPASWLGLFRPLQASATALETGLLNEVSLGSLARKGFILEEIRPRARLPVARLLRLLFH